LLHQKAGWREKAGELSDEAAVLRSEDEQLIVDHFSCNSAGVQVYVSAWRTVEVPNTVPASG